MLSLNDERMSTKAFQWWIQKNHRETEDSKKKETMKSKKKVPDEECDELSFVLVDEN